MKNTLPKSFILDIYGAFVRDMGGWIAVSNLVELMEYLGYEETHTRMSVSRFAKKGLLERRKINGNVGYQLTPYAESILAEGDDRIYGRLEPSQLDDGWVLVTFSIPENVRAQRHQLRSRLMWLGFGSLGGGAWIAPHRMLQKVREVVRDLRLEDHVHIFECEYQGLSSHEALIDQCWDLRDIEDTYEDYVTVFGPVIKRYENVDTDEVQQEAFIDYIESIHEWRKLPFRDPGLPLELLPEDWSGREAANIFRRIQEHLEPAARRFVIAVVSG